MTISFDATYTDVSKEPSGSIVTIAESNNTDDQYLMFQAKNEYDKQDIKLGMNDIYIECCGQGWSWYGHIVSFVLTPKTITVQLDNEPADEMSNNGLIRINLLIEQSEFPMLKSEFSNIFSGKSYYEFRQA